MHKNPVSTLTNKTTATAIVLLLSLTLTAIALPVTYAHTPPWQITTYAYINAAPNPVGVGQETLIVVWLDVTIQGVSITNNIRFQNYKLTITKPDGTTETKTWPTVTDTTSSAYTPYTPTQAGTYTLKFEFPGQTYTFSGAYQNDTYTPSSKTTTLTVQEDPIPRLPTTPLPTEYWTRPIEAENLAWGEISSNWLGGAATGDIWQKNGAAPRTPHVMWTRRLELGGVVGGTQDQDATFYSGFSYETRFNNPIIISGILYYVQSLNHAGSGGGYHAVDLRTGEEIWHRDDLGSLTNPAPSKAQLLNFQSPNQHGVVGGTLWQVSGSTWIAIDALTGKWVCNLTGVPSGTEAYTTKGDIVRYILSYNTTTRAGRLLVWNTTAAIGNTAASMIYGGEGWRPAGQIINASTSASYSLNVTVTADLTGNSAPTIVGVLPGDLILGRSSAVGLTSLPAPNPNPWTLWALNLNESKGAIGSLLWRKDYSAPAGNITRMMAWQPLDPVYRTFTMTDFETGQRLGYSLNTGELLWGPLGEQPGFQYYASREGFPAYGNLYVSGYGGVVFCYSMKDGTLLWKYNNTSSGLETPWGNYPTHAAAVANGILFTMSGEHSPNTPLYKGYRARAINATTGEEIWTLLDWSASGLGTSVAPVAVADGFMTFANAYDGQIYCVGKGVSGATVEAPLAAITLGQSLVVTGTVTDQSPGSKAKGTAAVSDDSMTAWMEYQFMQKPKPLDAKGVEVTISVVDANNNYRDIGKTTTDLDGFFSFQWKPDIEGKYIVYASFAGSEAYWPSHAVAAFAVDPAPQEEAPPEEEPSMTDTYLLVGVVAIIIAVLAVGTAILLTLRKRA